MVSDARAQEIEAENWVWQNVCFCSDRSGFRSGLKLRSDAVPRSETGLIYNLEVVL